MSGLNLVFSDTASGQAPQTGTFTGGSYRPTSYPSGQATTYCQAATCDGVTVSEEAPNTFTSAAPLGSGTFLNQFAGAGTTGTWQLFTVNRTQSITGSVSNT